jgi:predicted anti-sigma-YlaC factor YlaD
MDHQPFENWILSEEPLSPENTGELETHLEKCDHCRELQNAWSGVIDLFQEVPEVEPLPGFVNRWQERLAVEKHIELFVRQRWQSMIMLILLGNVIAGLVFFLGTEFLTNYDTPLSLVMSGVYRFVSLVTTISAIQNIFLTLFRTITSVVPAGIWAILGMGLIGSGAIWIISIKTLSVLPRRM